MVFNSDLQRTYDRVYKHILESGIKWRFDGIKALPTLEDIQLLVGIMIEDVRESSDSISVESGGILVKRNGDCIDVYVHVGGINEDCNV